MSEAALYMIRHGHTTWNGPPTRMQGNRGESHLSPRGRDEALALGPRMPAFERIISSPLARCLETTDCLFARAPDATDPRLAEIDVGRFSGRLGDEVASSDPEGWRVWRELPPGERIGGDGETIDEFQARVVAAVKDALDSVAAGERVLLVAHGGCIRVTDAWTKDVPVAPFSVGSVANLGLFRIARAADGTMSMVGVTPEEAA